jgi:ubiquinone/menaquinone biosynthesis C-methylase UbiE
MRLLRKRTFIVSALVITGLSLYAAAQSSLEETWEKEANRLQPPQEVMDRIGVQPGQVIGEIGAGRGRYTVHLAGRVGPQGRIFANDINARALDFLAERCRKNGIVNIETVLGGTDDPRFPVKNLDMIFMVWTYHMMEKPVAMLRSMASYLKAGASVVMIEPIPAETEKEIQSIVDRTGQKPTDVHVVTKENLAKDAAEAGFELVRADTSLKEDVIYVLRVRPREGLGK